MKENQNIEWKESWRDEFLKWICGFANAEGGVLVIGRDDRGRAVGLTNAARLLEEIPSHPFNPLLASAFFRAGYVESWGRGIEKMRRECANHDAPAPIFDTSMSGLMLTFKANPVHLAAALGEKSASALLNPAGEVAAAQPESRPESQPESLELRLLAMLADEPLSKAQLSSRLGHKEISGQLNKVMRLLLAEDNIEYTLPDKPSSRLQKYRLTGKGRAVRSQS